MNVSNFRWIILSISTIILLFGGLFLLSFGSSIPDLSCRYSIDRSGTCFLYTLQRYLGAPSLESTLTFIRAFLVFSGLVLLLGKLWCGWLCPFGFIQDIIDLARRRIFRINALRFSEKTRKNLSALKWIFLLIAIIVPLVSAYPVLAYGIAIDLTIPFCQLCPGKYIIPLFTKGAIELCSLCPGKLGLPPNAGSDLRVAVYYHSPTSVAMSLLGITIAIVVLFGSFLKRRFFCTYCPMGLLISFYNKINFLSLKKDTVKCTYCEACYNACPVDIKEVYSEREKETIQHSDCIMCFKCIENCPEDGALYMTFLGGKIYTSNRKAFCRKTKRILK